MKGYSVLSRLHVHSLPSWTAILVAAFFFTFGYSPRAAYSAQVSLAWQASSGDVAGYNVYQGTSSRDYDESMDVGNWTSVTISGLEDNETYYFAVTAYNSDGDESGYSNEVCLNCSTASTTTPEASNNSSGGGGGCFIAASAHGSTMVEEVVDFISKHIAPKAIVQWGLLSSVAMSWTSLRIGCPATAALAGLFTGLLVIGWLVLFKGKTRGQRRKEPTLG